MRTAAVIVLSLLLASAPALARKGGHHSGGHRVHHGGHHHGGHHHHFRSSVSIGFGFWGGWWPYYYPYAYYPPQVVYAEAPQPVAYVEQRTAPAPAQNGWWYYCDSANGYYPYVRHCPERWRRVSPTPPR